MLQVTGAALAATVGSGYVVADTNSSSAQQGDPIEFENSRELLLEQSQLPEDGWTEAETGEGDVLDASVTYQREYGSGGSDVWVVISAAAGRETEAEATDLYGDLAAGFLDRVGEARTMDLDLASEAAIAGFDGYTAAIFRDVNCVGSVWFQDCSSSGTCLSHVGRCERLARTQQQFWRGEATGDGEDGESEETTTENDGGDTQNVDEIDGQVSLAFGETATVSNGVETTVYEGTLYGQMGDQTPQQRDRFLVVPVEAVNTSDQARMIPDQTHSWEVLFGDQQVSNVFRIGALDAEGYQAFEGGEVQAGVRREGVLLFEVDEGYATDDIDVLWQDEFLVAANLDGGIDVRWSADG